MAYKYTRKDNPESTTQQSRWRDFDLSFEKNPVTNDITVLTDQESIKQAVKNIVLTNFYERPFQPTLGTSLRDLLFEPMVPMTLVMIQKKVSIALRNFEPRINLEEVKATGDPDKNEIKISIRFNIKDFISSTDVSVTLRRTR